MNNTNLKNIEKLNYLAWKSRYLCTKTFHESGKGGHFGGSFSSAEILTTLYNGILRIDPKNPKWPNRDHLIVSKGHMAGILASVLAIKGFFLIKKLSEYDQLGSAFGMHTTRKIIGCEFATGSLGHGLGVGIGVAIAKKMDHFNSRVFVLMGDGELDEGSVWEAFMSANKFHLDNLIAIIDRNMFNMEGNTEQTMPLEPLHSKLSSFGWEVKTIDGHDVQELYNTLSKIPFTKDKPSCIIAKTIKGKGLALKEGVYKSHYIKMNDRDYKDCIANIKEKMLNSTAKVGENE